MPRTVISPRYCLLAFAALLLAGCSGQQAAPIKIGVLHALSGTMAVSEQPLVDAVRLAVAEINADGGLLGRPVEVVVADGRSDPQVFAAEARRLIEQEHVDALFGCWTSACRKAVRPVVEAQRHLLFYPVQYEGMEQSPHIIYTGAAPNQQIVPGARWALTEFGKRVYLIGSDYIFPRTAHRILRDSVESNGGQIVGEQLLPLGTADMAKVVADIVRTRPDVVLNTLNGDSNHAWFDALVGAGLADLPLMSFSTAEPEMRAWGGGRLTRHYVVWSYFQSLETPENTRFVRAFRQLAGPGAVTCDPVASAYTAVKLWASAVRVVESSAPARVNTAALLRQSIKGPVNIVSIDANTRHLWKRVRIGRTLPDGQFAEVFASTGLIRPAPWPIYRDKQAWQRLTGIAP